MKTRTLLSAIIGAFATFSFATAAACLPPPPPPQDVGESEEAYAGRVAAFQAAQDAEHAAWLHARQMRLWDESESVFLARIERVLPGEPDYFGETQRVRLRPERTLKGRRYTGRFALAYTGANSCGREPSFDALTGSVGDEFVVFVRGGRPRQATVQQAIAVANITDERIRAALAAAE